MYLVFPARAWIGHILRKARIMTDIAELDLRHAGRRVTGHGLDAWFAEARETLKLAGPLVFTQVAQMTIMTTDVVMLGRVGQSALASAALGITIFFFCWLIGAGPVAAVAPMIAHILGAKPGDRGNVRSVVRMGFWSVVIVSLPLMALLLFTRPILLLLGQQPELAARRRAVHGGFVPRPALLAFYQVLRNFSTALERPRRAARGDGDRHRVQFPRRLHADLRTFRLSET